MKFIFALAALVAAAVITAEAQPTHLLLTNYNASDCNGTALPYKISVPLDTCLNNHDFDSASCPVFESCTAKLSNQFPGAVIPYSALVNCTNAPKMHLSVRNSYDSSKNELSVKAYALSEECWGIPLPLHYKSGACASTFALSKKCGVAGCSLSWM